MDSFYVPVSIYQSRDIYPIFLESTNQARPCLAEGIFHTSKQ